MVRLVFGDNGWSTSFDASYVNAYGAPNVLGQLYDSAFVSSSSPSVNTAVSVTKEYLAAFPDIGIWEVGNEINGAPGGGWLTGCPSDSTTFTSSTPCVGVYYNIWKTVSAAGKPTALTFFWTGPNDAANTSKGYDLLGYAQHLANAFPDMASGLNYIFVSYYGTSGNQSPSTGTTVADIESLFNSLHAMFPNAKLGWGEIGAAKACTSSTESSQLASLNYYYSTIPTLTSGASWVGGGFWWNWGEDASGPCASQINSALSTYSRQY
jgi:hypothetical protein